MRVREFYIRFHINGGVKVLCDTKGGGTENVSEGIDCSIIIAGDRRALL